MSRVITVRVKPGSRGGPKVTEGEDGTLTLAVRERAVDGKATEAAAKLLAEHLGVRRGAVTLVSGASARVKRFRVSAS